MINKRLLIKNLLAHNSENSFYDKKRKIHLDAREGKAKFLKHVCALANSNPDNNAYMVIGVEDSDNQILGVDFFDDSKIQNLINAYLNNPPFITYENIPFPHLPDDRVVGLVTIRPNKGNQCSLQKNIWKYEASTVFFREGSISMPTDSRFEKAKDNRKIVQAIEAHSQNNVQLTLDGVFDFFEKHEDLEPKYNVFKEYFVVCWSGKKKRVKDKTYYSRVDIALINEQVKLFYSELDEVIITISADHFRILEFVKLGFNDKYRYFPLEEVEIHFKDNASYEINTQLVFEPPQYEKSNLYHIYNTNEALLKKLRQGQPLTSYEKKDIQNLPAIYLICYFNGFDRAIDRLEEAREQLKNYDLKIYQQYKEVIRILRKVKYN